MLYNIHFLERKTIVFDIDETLLFAQKEPFNKLEPSKSCSAQIRLRHADGSLKEHVYLQFRPYLLEMLIELYPDFELVLFTKATSDYA